MSYTNKLAFLQRVLGRYKFHSNTNEAEFFSPFCSHHKPKLSINLETDRWRCWISGNNGKKLLYVIKEGGGTREDIREYIQKYKAKDVKLTMQAATDAVVKLSLPKEYIPLVNCRDSILGLRAYTYLESRGITDSDVLRHKIGLAVGGDYAGRIVFPSFCKKGVLNFFTTRDESGHYLNAKGLPKGHKNTIILNELNIDWNKPVVITEGFVDMYKSVRNTIPLAGTFLHDESLLFEKIIESNTDIVMALDQDAWKLAESLAKKLSNYGTRVYTLDLNGYSDLGDMPKDQVEDAYQNASLWTPESSFRKRLSMLC